MSQRALGTDSPARHASRLAAAHSGSAGPPVGGGTVGPCLTGQHLALSWPGRWPPPEPQTKLGPLRGPSWPCAPAPPTPPRRNFLCWAKALLPLAVGAEAGTGRRLLTALGPGAPRLRGAAQGSKRPRHRGGVGSPELPASGVQSDCSQVPAQPLLP